MKSSQRYVGSPNGIVLCVDQTDDRKFTGRFYNFYSRTATEFENVDELMFEMETFFNELNFPYPATGKRTFAKRKTGHMRECKEERNGNCMVSDYGKDPCRSRGQERVKVMDEKELLRRHGNLGTFIVRVQQRQNSSWQGRITWSDRNETVNFRSAWELVRLIADALDMSEQPEERNRWPEGRNGWPEGRM